MSHVEVGGPHKLMFLQFLKYDLGIELNYAS